MVAGSFVLRCRRGQAGGRELQAEAEAVIAELADPASDAAESARQAGLDPAQVRGTSTAIVEEQQGFDPVTTTILVTIATELGVHVAKTVWDRVIWPRLERKFGVRALGARVENE